MGCNHAQIGGLIAKRWKFPEILVDSIAYHHAPRSKDKSNIVMDAVHVCNSVAKMIGIGIGIEEMKHGCVGRIGGALLGLTPDR